MRKDKQHKIKSNNNISKINKPIVNEESHSEKVKREEQELAASIHTMVACAPIIIP